jgi:hypothetical protein
VRGAGVWRDRWTVALLGALVAWLALLLASGLAWHPGLHDNDWPLLMWLAMRASPSEPGPLAIGHYGFLQLLLVRWLLPLAGSTLVAAKALSAVAGALAAFAASRLVGGGAWGLLAGALVLGSPELLLAAQSEWGDALAVACMACALWCYARAGSVRALAAAGCLFGLAGSFRVHFQAFALAAAAAVAALEPIAARPRAGRRALAYALGTAAGLLPAIALNLRVHATPFSPIAHTFVGQALLGVEMRDLGSHYADHPFAKVWVSHRGELIAWMLSRLPEIPLRWLALWGAALAGFAVSRRDWPLRALLLALATGYTVAFVCPAWGVTERLLLPLAALLPAAFALSLAAAAEGARPPRRAALGLAGAALAAALAAGGASEVRAALSRVDAGWARSAGLTAELRALGAGPPEEVFCSDWDPYPTDRADFVGWYGWGFWNLLDPGYAAARPNPFPLLRDPPAFTAFLRARGVRFLVLSEAFLAEYPELRRPPGFRLAAFRGDDLIYRLE